MRPRHLLLHMAALFILSACVGSPSQPTNFYLLASSEGTTEGAELEKGKSVLLGPVALPAYLDRPQIVTQNSPNRLKLSELDQWAEPLQDSLQRVMIENLSRQLKTENIYSFPASMRPGPDIYQLAIQFTDIRMTQDGVTRIKVRWSLHNNLDGRPLIREGKEYQNQDSADFEGYARSLSKLLEELSKELAQTVRQAALGS